MDPAMKWPITRELEERGLRQPRTRTPSDLVNKKVQQGSIKVYREKADNELCTELVSMRNEILAIMDERLIPNSNVPESTMFYYEMKK
uniref:Uncharacterized protein n=1 Tax=Globisporangium ultimum (strain ATCC 200006 / CBS 805.95 / DAOM BR144) TaxID=431595 RepID=K3W6B0_GLOUD